MTKIADLLDNLPQPVQEVVCLNKDDPETVFTELGEYIATDRLRADYESLFSAVSVPCDSVALWISGFFGSGKTSFAKNLAYVLANSASSVFIKRMESVRISEWVECLNRTVLCEVFTLDASAELPADANAKQIAETMYRVALRNFNCEETRNVSDAELALNRLFDVCEIRRPGKTLAFILDNVGQHLAVDSERRRNLRLLIEQFGKVSLERVKAGKIPGPAWIMLMAEEKLHESLQDCFTHWIDLSDAGIAEVAARRVLRKKDCQKFLLRKLFQEHRASLVQNIALNEDQFVDYYPFLPQLMDISIDIVAGIRRDLNAPTQLIGGSRSIVKQCYDLLWSDQTHLASKPIGTLVSIEHIYDLLEGTLPPGKSREIAVIGERCEHERYPGMAARVAKAICMMEFVRRNLPRTTQNIAALLIQHVSEPPPTAAVAAILENMRDEHLVREAPGGWKLYQYDFDELRHRTAALHGLRIAVGTVNPRLPGWRNDLVQLGKQSIARGLSWYTRRLHDFNGSVSRSLEEIVVALDRLIDLPIDIMALRKRLAQSEKTIAGLQKELATLQEQVSALRTSSERTAYVLGLFGTGRLYVCDLLQQNIGERAKYFRDQIRLHLGPTPMIYSGHATIRHVSRAQNLPALTSRLLEGVRAGFADLIFVYRHPLDSLLTNWVWWRQHLRDSSCVSGIAQVYRNTDDLCADLERNFLEFKMFAEGDPAFFAHAELGPRFLSFSEFVEETELFLQCGPTLSLRLEDFMIDPVKEFSRIAEVMSVDIDPSGLYVAPPKSKPYGYLAVREKVPRFRSHIDGLNVETKRRIERIGYQLAT